MMTNVIRVTIMALVVGLLSFAHAEEGSHKKEAATEKGAAKKEMKEGSHKKEAAKKEMKEGSHKKKPALQEIAVTGKVIAQQVESKKTREDGTKISYTKYWLEYADGRKVPLSKARAKKGQEPAYDLDALAGKTVSIKAKGHVRGEGDKALSYPREILSIEEVAAE